MVKISLKSIPRSPRGARFVLLDYNVASGLNRGQVMTVSVVTHRVSPPPCSILLLHGIRLLLIATYLMTPSLARPHLPNTRQSATKWNNAVLQGVRDSRLGAQMVSRSLAIIHTCMYDAWAAYDDKGVGTQLNSALRRPLKERTLANKEKAISYAAYRALSDVL